MLLLRTRTCHAKQWPTLQVDVIFDWEGANGDLDASKLVVFARESNLIGFSFT